MIRRDASSMNPAQWASYATEAFEQLIKRVRAGVELNASTDAILATFPR